MTTVLDFSSGKLGRVLVGPTLVVAGTGICALVLALGVPMGGDVATGMACLALLMFGLPHGTLDLELIRSRVSGPLTRLSVLVSAYLALALAMYALWRVEPVAALASFVAIAVFHFSEDWEGADSGLLQAGLALAILSMPALLHRTELDAVFISLTGRDEAVVISDGLLLLAPVSIGLTAVCIFCLYQGRRHDQAIGAIVSLLAMMTLPPVVGFACYFCLFHSPRNFRETLADLNWSGFAQWGRIVVPLTLVAGVLAGLVLGLEVRPALSDSLVAASFMTLSILTVPHMIIPFLIGRLSVSHARND